MWWFLPEPMRPVTGHYEQLSVCVHYFNKRENRPVKHYGIEIDWNNVITVCFYGAASMAGSCNNVQSTVKENKSSIYYVHCYAHYLNLVLIISSRRKNNVIFDFFGVVQIIYSFLEANSCYSKTHFKKNKFKT